MNLNLYTKCLKRGSYQEHSEFYTKRFFGRLSDDIDHVHGLLSPYYFVIFNNDLDLLTGLLRAHGYKLKYRLPQGSPDAQTS